jgi:hypothetical protein
VDVKDKNNCFKCKKPKLSCIPGYSPGIFALYSLSEGFVKKPGKETRNSSKIVQEPASALRLALLKLPA